MNRGAIVMECFAVRPSTWPVLRIFSRNPLVRGSDRVDDVVAAVAVLLVVVAAACAGVLGTVTHDVAKQRYLDQAATRHTVTATALADSTPSATPTSAITTVAAQWRADGRNHTDTVTWPGPVKVGQQLTIWVGSDGDVVEAPSPVARAGTDAVVIALVAFWVGLLFIAHIVGLARARIARLRDSQWDNDIRALVDDKGGWASYS